MLLNLIKIAVATIVAFFIALFSTPVATHFFYKYKMWKRYSRSASVESTHFHNIHNESNELNTPRVGGIIIWFSVLLTTLIFYLLPLMFSHPIFAKLNFLSRNQTLIPFFTLIFGALLGLWDDLIQIYGHGKIAHDDISWRKWKVILVSVISFSIGLWFFFKLEMVALHIPFDGALYFGVLLIPFFMMVALATFSGGVIDGIDGLSGGVLAAIFGAYSFIALANNQIDLAAFSGAITGGTLAFLWFNVPPARFYMGETGIIGLTITLATLAFLTDTVFVLPVVAFPLVITSASVIIQMFSKRFLHRKVFIVAPLHHHFEALGWSAHRVTMRFWILSTMFALIGLILTIISR